MQTRWYGSWSYITSCLALRFAAVYCGCGWSSYLSNSFVRCAFGININAGTVVVARSAYVRLQVHLCRARSVPESKWR